MGYWKNGSKEPPTEFFYLRNSNALPSAPEEVAPDDLFDDPAEVDPDNLSDDPETNAPLRSDRPDALPKDKRQQHISKEEELRLIALAQGNDPKEKQNAIAALLEAYTGFLWQKILARKGYFSANITPEDLFQEARMGLMHAIEKFDPGKGVKLTSYAGWWIDRAFSNYILKNATTQSVATRLDPVYRKILGAYQDYMKARRRKKGDEPLSYAEKQEICDLTGKWPHEIDEIQARVYGGTYSLNTPIGGEADGVTFLDILTEGPFAPPDALASDLSDRQFIKTLIAAADLTKRERDILFARFGIGTHDGRSVTLGKIGKHFGLTAEGVRQIEGNSLKKLRQANSNRARPQPAIAPSTEYPATPDGDAPDSAEEERRQTIMGRGKIKTLEQTTKYQSKLRPVPMMDWNGYNSLNASTIRNIHSVYQIVMEIQNTGKPIVLLDSRKGTIRGLFVLPEMADQLATGELEQRGTPLGYLSTSYLAYIRSAEKDGVLWLKEGGGDQRIVLALLPPTPETIKLLDRIYGKNAMPDITPNQTQDLQMETSPAPDTGKTSTSIEPQAAAPDPGLALEPEESASEQTALRVQAPEDKEPEAQPAFLTEFFPPETLLADTDPIPTYDLPNPRDLTQTLRTLFAAVSEAQKDPQTPVRIEYPGNAVLVSADPWVLNYLLCRAEIQGTPVLKAETEDVPPGDDRFITLLMSFAGAAKGRICIVPVDGTDVALFPDNCTLDAAQFMQAVLNHAFPQPQGAG